MKAETLTLKVPKLKGALFESAVIDRYRRREESVEEALIDMYLAGVLTRQVDGHRQAFVGRAYTLPDALGQARARVRGHRPVAEPSPVGAFIPVSVRGRVRRQARLGRIGRDGQHPSHHRRGRHGPPGGHRRGRGHEGAGPAGSGSSEARSNAASGACAWGSATGAPDWWPRSTRCCLMRAARSA